MSAMWYWTLVVCQWIGLLYMAALAAVFIFVATAVLGGSVLSRRREERRFSREIARAVAGLTEEEVREWLR